MSALYDRLGGETAIFAAVDGLYRRIIADEELRPFFDGVDMDGQTKKMVGFLARAFGGPVELQGRDLRVAHAGLVARGLSDRHFDAVLVHLDDTLRGLDVDQPLRAEVLAIAESTRGEVLGGARG